MGLKGIVAVLSVWFSLAQGYGQKETVEETVKNFQELYEEGREAYLENNYGECVKLFEAALRDYKHYTKVLVDCKSKCKESLKGGSQLELESPDMKHYHQMIQETLCNMKCKLRALPKSRSETIRDDIRTFFEERKPYDFLQLCYYQVGKHQAAASAAFTNLAVNPEAEVMRENLNYYLALPSVVKEDLVDLEAKAWMKPYLSGQTSYVEENWSEMVQAMEESLRLYLKEEDDCRLQCDKPFDQKWYPDFTSSVANHFTFCLKCSRNCPETLNNLNGEFTDDLLSTFYHYLQFGYYNLGESKKAAQAASTFLLLLPDHEDMAANLEYYTQVDGVTGVWLSPREEAVRYMAREKDEEALLDFITKSFVFNESDTEQELDEEEPAVEEDKEGHDIEEEEEEEDGKEFVAKWSHKEKKYLIEEKEDDLLPALMPPPVVKFEL